MEYGCLCIPFLPFQNPITFPPPFLPPSLPHSLPPSFFPVLPSSSSSYLCTERVTLVSSFQYPHPHTSHATSICNTICSQYTSQEGCNSVIPYLVLCSWLWLLMVCCWTHCTGTALPVSQSQSGCGCTVQSQGHPTQSSLLRLSQSLWSN